MQPTWDPRPQEQETHPVLSFYALSICSGRSASAPRVAELNVAPLRAYRSPPRRKSHWVLHPRYIGDHWVFPSHAATRLAGGCEQGGCAAPRNYMDLQSASWGIWRFTPKLKGRFKIVLITNQKLRQCSNYSSYTIYLFAVFCNELNHIGCNSLTWMCEARRRLCSYG